MTDSNKMAKLTYEALEDKKAVDIKIINIAGVSVLGDYFIIAGGENANQVQAMADNVMEMLGRAGFECKNVEGYHGADWILQDYGDVIVHIFNKEARKFYDLERIWRDGKIVSPEEL